MKLMQLTDMFGRRSPRPLGLGLGGSSFSHQHAQDWERAQESNLLFVEFVGVDQIGAHIAAWEDLAARVLEPNVFLEPSFALPAARHLAEADNIGFLLAWDQATTSPRGQLVALWPVAPYGALFGLNVRTWIHDFCCSGAPLLDRARAFIGLDACLHFLNESARRTCVLTTSQLKRSGPTFALLSQYASAKGLELEIIRQYSRAALQGSTTGVSSRDLVSSKKRKELQRQWRRLCERGPVTFGVSRDSATLRQQIESFLILEAKGWKGRSGSAFLNQPELTAFLRAMTRTMGEEKCRIYWIACSGKLIAANILLLDGESAFFWKTAYDESFAFASPGVLLTMKMTDLLLSESHILEVDSCAAPDHPMIDHIWRERIPMADVMLSLNRNKIHVFNGAVQREQFKLRLRERAKSVLSHLNLT